MGAAVLAALLSLDRLFQGDFEDGSLDVIALSPLPLESAALAKILAHWLSTGLPLTLFSPLLALMFNLPRKRKPGAVCFASDRYTRGQRRGGHRRQPDAFPETGWLDPAPDYPAFAVARRDFRGRGGGGGDGWHGLRGALVFCRFLRRRCLLSPFVAAAARAAKSGKMRKRSDGLFRYANPGDLWLVGALLPWAAY